MADQAKITSLDALQSFRAHLVIFITKARRSLDQSGDEIRRARAWVQTEQRTHWEGQIRRRRRMLEQVEGELMTARMSEFVDSPSQQQAAVRKAKAAVAEAEQKLERVKAWNRNFDSTFDPHVRKMEMLRDYVDHDLPKAVAYLDQVQKILESYHQVGGPAPSGPSTSLPSAAESEQPS
ncbi:hypothetical protein [Verrucomicrobium spinosum]|uniref:hypothetical protein n=1 Tax=Verrucomicrobium spinosum TaxID=2736 RepID=UPI00017460B8|nr:hypothetical protein [Verrucomicrobium spinosum]